MSKQYENDMAKEMYRATGPQVRLYRCGYSGSNAMPQPDVLVTDVMENHGLEIKGPIASNQCRVEEDDVQQLLDCENANTSIYLVIKFQNREPLVVRYFDELTGEQMKVDGAKTYNDLSPAEKFAALAPPAFNAHVTDSGTLVFDKPSTDDWPSARAGASDVDAILSGIGITTEKSVEVT